MALCRFLMMCVTMGALLWCSVSGDCDIKKIPKCDMMFPKVVDEMVFNGTCIHTDTPHLFIGDTYQLKVTFTPVADAESAWSSVLVELPLGILIPVHLDDPDACSSMGLACPLKANTSYTLTSNFLLQRFPVYSTMNARIHWALVDKPSDARPQHLDTEHPDTDYLDTDYPESEYPEVVYHKEEHFGVDYYKKQIFCVSLDTVVEPQPQPPREEGMPSFRVVH